MKSLLCFYNTGWECRFLFVWIVLVSCIPIVEIGVVWNLSWPLWLGNGWVVEHIWFRTNDVPVWGMFASEWGRDDFWSDRYDLKWRCWAYLHRNGLRTELRWFGMTEPKSIFGLVWSSHWASNGVDQCCGTVMVYCGFVSGTWSRPYLAQFLNKYLYF